MLSISVGELKNLLEDYPDDYEVIMNIHHRYPISEEEGTRGWISYIDGIYADENRRELRLMN